MKASSDRTLHEENQELIDESGIVSQDLVGPAEPLSVLRNEYRLNNKFLRHAEWLVTASEYTGFHRLKGDGNCFYRAFSYAFVDAISRVVEDELKGRILRHVDSTLETLKQSGNNEEIVMDFFEPFQGILKRVVSSLISRDQCAKEIFSAFNDIQVSNSIVFYVRLVASAFLKVRIILEHTHNLVARRSLLPIYCQ